MPDAGAASLPGWRGRAPFPRPPCSASQRGRQRAERRREAFEGGRLGQRQLTDGDPIAAAGVRVVNSELTWGGIAAGRLERQRCLLAAELATQPDLPLFGRQGGRLALAR